MLGAEITKECFFLTCFPWLAQSAFLYSLGPGITSLTVGAGPSHVNHESRKFSQRLTHQSIWWRHFLSWGPLFQNDSSLCQVGTKLDSIMPMEKNTTYAYRVLCDGGNNPGDCSTARSSTAAGPVSRKASSTPHKIQRCYTWLPLSQFWRQ